MVMLFAPQSEYYHAKAACYLCGRTDTLVDTEVIVEGEGVLAICIGCVKGDLLLAFGINFAALEAAAERAKALEEALAIEKAGTREANRRAREAKKALSDAIKERPTELVGAE